MIETSERPGQDGAGRDGLAAVSVVERQLSADGVQWLSLGLVAVAAVVADQVTKHVVSSQLAVGEETAVAGPFSIHHVHNSGIAFGLFAGEVPVEPKPGRCDGNDDLGQGRSVEAPCRRLGPRSPDSIVPSRRTTPLTMQRSARLKAGQ